MIRADAKALHGAGSRRRERPSRSRVLFLLAGAALAAAVTGSSLSHVAAAPPARAATAEGAPESLLLARLLGPTPILDDLQELTDSIGGRPTGSAALERAVDWGVRKLRAAGADAVRTEEFTLPHTWVAGSESGEVEVTLDGKSIRSPLRVAGMPFSTTTPEGGTRAGVTDVGDGVESGFAAAGSRLRGRWALVHTEPMKSIDDLFGEYMATPGIFDRAKAAGAVGVLWISNRPGRLLYRHNVALDGSIYPLPGVIVEREGGLRIARLLSRGADVVVRAGFRAEIRAEAKSRNVVAEIRGGTEPSEVVILGAHLDSWDLGRGALDNGCNASLVIDVARQAAALVKAAGRPRRTLRFVLYTGEEAGIFGSLAEVRIHAKDLDRVQAQVVIDEGSGKVTGFSLGGRAELGPAVDAALSAAAGLGPFRHTPDAFAGTDNLDYLLEGVPNLVANQEGAPYLPDYHAESDTFDKVDTSQLKANAAVLGVLVWHLADQPGRLAARLNHDAIEALAARTGLDTQLKTFSLWEDFESGRRGRRP
jgi:carboxypeptidase Q